MSEKKKPAPKTIRKPIKPAAKKKPDPAPQQWAKLCAKIMDTAAQQLEIQSRLATIQAELEDVKKKHQASEEYAVRVRCVLANMQSAIQDVFAIPH